MDESEQPALHQWLSICRYMMAHHPRQAARAAEMFFGGELLMRPGWNRAVLGSGKELFTWVGGDRGETVSVLPPGVSKDQVHDIPIGTPHLPGSRLWALCTSLADVLTRRDLPDYPADKVKRIMDNIARRAAASDGVKHDWGMMGGKVKEAIGSMKNAIMETQAGKIDMGGVLKPAIGLVRSYLDFEIPGMEAREVLAVVLQMQCNLPYLGPPQKTPPGLRERIIEHLGDLTWGLLKLREGKKLTPYCGLTFLAGLYAGTTMVLIDHAIESVPEDSHDRLRKLMLNVDEMFAHEVMPKLQAAAMTPLEDRAGMMGEATARQKTEAGGVPRSSELPLAISDQQFRQHFEPLASYDVEGALLKELDPIPFEVKEKVLLDLTALSMGCSG